MRPLRPATHKAVAPGKLASLAEELTGIANDGIVEVEALLDLASELGVGGEKLLAAMPQAELVLQGGSAATFEVCVGGCQEWGALDVAERLLDAWEERSDSGASLFNIVPRACLDKCQGAAAVIIDTGDGRAVIDRATPDKIDEALDAL